MEEFLKIKWQCRDVSLIEQQIEDVPDQIVASSHVYKHLAQPFSDPRTSNDDNETLGPYVPGKTVYRPIFKRSLLTKQQKRECLDALKLYQTGKKPETMSAKERHNFTTYTNLQTKIVEENRQFCDFVKGQWFKDNQKPQKIKQGALTYARYNWERKSRRYLELAQFYKELSLLSLTYEQGGDEVVYENTATPLELGTVAVFMSPTLLTECILPINGLPKLERTPFCSKLDVSKDVNVTKLLAEHPIDVVASLSSLKQMIDPTGVRDKWIIPIKIHNITTNDNKTTRKVVFIDKPLAKTQPEIQDFKNYVAKLLLRTNLCKYQAFSFSECDKSAPEESQFRKIKGPLKQMQGQVHHNVSYRVWKIKKTSDGNTLMKNKGKNTEINLLVRCKLDGCQRTEQDALQPVVVSPKIEEQLEYGATIPSKRELSRMWTDLFFRPFSTVHRVHLSDRDYEVIAMDKCSLQKVNTEAATYYSYKPNLGLGVLQRVLETLINLEVGNYILQHLPKHQGFVSIMRECEKEAAHVFDLHKEYQDRTKSFKNVKHEWIPIDVNYILPAHDYYRNLPGMFEGFDQFFKPVGAEPKRKKKRKYHR